MDISACCIHRSGRPRLSIAEGRRRGCSGAYGEFPQVVRLGADQHQATMSAHRRSWAAPGCAGSLPLCRGSFELGLSFAPARVINSPRSGLRPQVSHQVVGSEERPDHPEVIGPQRDAGLAQLVERLICNQMLDIRSCLNNSRGRVAPCTENPMCGRYDNLIAKDAYRALFKADRLPRSNFPPRYNIAPTDQIPIIRVDPRDGERERVGASSHSG